MAKKHVDVLPEKIYVYVCDWVDGAPLLAVTTCIKELTSNEDDTLCATYAKVGKDSKIKVHVALEAA